jgi:ribulose-5-phosphate 4-epimerase/fuculose-1-phosphate aldolase
LQSQVNKYCSKLLRHGLIEQAGDVQLYGLDDEIYTNRPFVPPEVQTLFRSLNINSLLIGRPEPLRWRIIQELVKGNPTGIRPSDSESVTFIHDIPVVGSFDAGEIACALNRRKGCIVRDLGVVTTGSVSLEQAFIVMSSICFATFVKFFSDTLNGLHGFGSMGVPGKGTLDLCEDILSRLSPFSGANSLAENIPRDEAGIIQAMDAAGKATVAAGLVDSFFGNISFRQGDLIYISQTGSSLDDLPGRIDRVPLDGSSTCELTSSSELSSHVKIYETTRNTAILHGHPRFSVIMSMFGGPLAFGETRFIEEIPVVYGEVGAGRHGIVHTLPPAMQEKAAAIAYGHGVFTGSESSYHEAFEKLSNIEILCYERYREEIKRKL